MDDMLLAILYALCITFGIILIFIWTMVLGLLCSSRDDGRWLDWIFPIIGTILIGYGVYGFYMGW